MPCTQKGEKCGRMFEKASLAAPPAGFEPAHTAPEAVCELRPELQGLLGGWLSGPQVDRVAVEPCTISLGMSERVGRCQLTRRSAVLSAPAMPSLDREIPRAAARSGTQRARLAVFKIAIRTGLSAACNDLIRTWDNAGKLLLFR
jgi:hypothetical protein